MHFRTPGSFNFNQGKFLFSFRVEVLVSIKINGSTWAEISRNVNRVLILICSANHIDHVIKTIKYAATSKVRITVWINNHG